MLLLNFLVMVSGSRLQDPVSSIPILLFSDGKIPRRMQPGPVVGRSEIWGAAVDVITLAGPHMKGNSKVWVG